MAKPPVERVARVCLQHPHRPAAARCAQCAKPMCGQCLVEGAGERFCSDACAAARARFRQREAGAQGRRTAGRSRLGEWAVRGVILLLAGAILYYVAIAQHVRSVGDFGDMLRRMF